MARQDRLGKHMTTVSGSSGVMRVTYHNTEIVIFDSNKIILNSGGWLTPTTKTRMNQASNQFDLGYTVKQREGNWYVYHNRLIHPFKDGIELTREVVASV